MKTSTGRNRRLSARLLAAVALMMATLVMAAPVEAQEASATTTFRRNTRTIAPQASLSFPTDQTMGTPPPGGIASPELRNGPGEGDANVNRSLSPRPDANSIKRAAAAGQAVPVVPPTAISSTTTGLTRTFKGLDFFDQRFSNGGNQFSLEPPDQGLCVGNGFVLESVNSVLQVFAKDGTALSAPTDHNTFYGYPAAIDRTTGLVGPFIADPSCLYDSATQRWFLAVLTLDTDPTTGAFLGSNHIDVAVSQTNSPLGAWNFYVLPVQNDGTDRTPTHTDCPCVGDYPHIGADAHGFYVTTNEYPFSGPGDFGNNFNGAQLYAFSKDALAAGQLATVIHFENLTVGSGPTLSPGFTVWPSQSNGTAYNHANHGTENFLSSKAAAEALGTGMSSHIVLWSLKNTDSLNTAQPSLSLTSKLLLSETYGVPAWSEQKQGTVPLRDCIVTNCLAGIGPHNETEGPLDSLDSRMFQVWYSNGTLYSGLGTVMIVNGEVKAGVAWFNVAKTGSIVNQGYIGVADNSITFPSIAVAPDGTGAMALTLVGRDHFPSAAYVSYTGGVPDGPVRIAAKGRGPQDGFSEYYFFAPPDPAPRPRWGDYGAAVTDGSSTWLASEYIAQTCDLTTYTADTSCGATRGALANWATRITRIN